MLNHDLIVVAAPLEANQISQLEQHMLQVTLASLAKLAYLLVGSPASAAALVTRAINSRSSQAR
jgi:hypothetical protein